MGIVEKIKEIEEEMARTQKNKATEYHLGLLKAKLARYRAQLLEPTTKSSGGGTGFDVQKSGDARVALIGFPSVGKSTLLSKVTNTASEAAAYEFTTLTAIPGVIEYKGARIQLLDLPGIVEGASQGRGRGRQVVSTAKTADLILIMLDATKSEEHKRQLEYELDAVGIRLNKSKPDVVFKKKTTGGVTLNCTVKLTKTDEKTIKTILAGYKIHNCDVMIREDITIDEFIDVLIGTRKYIPCLYVYNKVDSISLELLDKIARQPNSVVISCELGLNLDYLIDRMWDGLKLVKVYTKKRGAHPDLDDPVCLRQGATVEILGFELQVCSRLGKSSKFSPHAQKVSLNHQVQDEDVVSRVRRVSVDSHHIHLSKKRLEEAVKHELPFVGRMYSTRHRNFLEYSPCGLPHGTSRGEALQNLPLDAQAGRQEEYSKKYKCGIQNTREGWSKSHDAHWSRGRKFRVRERELLTTQSFSLFPTFTGPRTIVVDVGKNFQAAAVEWFPKYGLRKIDAVLLTHPHADAMNGLDDLRGWTLNKSIQSHVDLYVSQDTFIEVQRSFPYLVSKEFASGGGDVPEFKWHIIEDTVPFEILDTGIMVTPFLVHHGRVFSQPPTPVYMPSPLSTTPGTPNLKFTNPTPIRPSALHARLEKQAEAIHPYKCFGFRFGQEVTYISDVSHIPEDKWSIIQPSGDRRLPVLVLDCLRLKPHTSHMGLEGSVDTARRIGASRTYLTGFSHDVSHDEFVTFGEAVGGKRKDTGLTEVEKQGLELVKSGQPAWVRPAHDGLRIFVEEDGRVRDETY